MLFSGFLFAHVKPQNRLTFSFKLCPYPLGDDIDVDVDDGDDDDGGGDDGDPQTPRMLYTICQDATSVLNPYFIHLNRPLRQRRLEANSPLHTSTPLRLPFRHSIQLGNLIAFDNWS